MSNFVFKLEKINFNVKKKAYGDEYMIASTSYLSVLGIWFAMIEMAMNVCISSEII